MSLLSAIRNLFPLSEDESEIPYKIEWGQQDAVKPTRATWYNITGSSYQYPNQRFFSGSGTPVKLTWGEPETVHHIRCSYCGGPWREDERGGCIRCGATE